MKERERHPEKDAGQVRYIGRARRGEAESAEHKIRKEVEGRKG